jgi:hypothetical protein
MRAYTPARNNDSLISAAGNGGPVLRFTKTTAKTTAKTV